MPYNPAIPVLGKPPKESKSVCSRDACILLFTMAEGCNQPRYLATNELIMKMYIYTMDCFLAKIISRKMDVTGDHYVNKISQI